MLGKTGFLSLLSVYYLYSVGCSDGKSLELSQNYFSSAPCRDEYLLSVRPTITDKKTYEFLMVITFYTLDYNYILSQKPDVTILCTCFMKWDGADFLNRQDLDDGWEALVFHTLA